MGEARILLREAPVAGSAAEVERKLSVLELLWNDGFVRKAVIILFLAAVWEAYGLTLDNPLCCFRRCTTPSSRCSSV
ncbi:hypothetical protein ACVWWO_004360 [Bradyrhizobium sp. F1.13.1]